MTATGTGGERRPAPPWLRPLGAWGAIALVLLVIQAMAAIGGPAAGPQSLRGWSQFDGPEYLAIAADGYQQRQLVWFPLYPLLIRGTTPVLGDPLLAAVTVSLLAGAACAIGFWSWCGRAGLATPARASALALLLVYPYGWFLYGVVYADALFLALCLAAFHLFERDRRALSAVAAALATATRPAGFALVAGLLVLAIERDGVLRVRQPGTWIAQLRLPTSIDRSHLRPATLWPAAGLAGIGAFASYQWWRFGSPMRFTSEQGNYHDPGWASLLKQQYFDAWNEGFDGRHLATTTFQAVLLALAIIAVPAIGRRFGWGYATFVLCLSLLPAISVSTFMGVGRYLLPAFPAFALAGELLATRPKLRAIVVLTSAVLIVVMSFGFARSWYLT